MSTTLTPPPLPPMPTDPIPPAASDGAPAPRAASKVIAILTIVAGGTLILGTVGAGILSSAASASVRTETLTADVSGLRGLDVDVSGAALTIVYGAVDQATLEVTASGGAADWGFGLDDDRELVVDSAKEWWGGWRLFGGTDRATLTLPEQFADEQLDASLSLSAGSIDASGSFGDLELDLSAGALDVRGSADTVDAHVSAGRATMDLADVGTAKIDLSAGSLDGQLTGTQPDAVEIEVSAGRVDIGMPQGQYAVASDVSAGDFTHDLSTDAASRHRVTVSVSAGAVNLYEAR